MFLVEDDRDGAKQFIFLVADPREDGYEGPLIEGVGYDNEDEDDHWPNGSKSPDNALARDPENRKSYKVFKREDEATSKGFELVRCSGHNLYNRWSDYIRST